MGSQTISCKLLRNTVAKHPHQNERNSGKLFLMSMELTPMELTLELQNSRWRESRFTITKPCVCLQKPRPRERSWCPVENLFQELSLWIWSPAPWTVSDPAPMEAFSDQTTLCLDSLELETTGPRVTTLRVLSWWTASSMWSEKRLKVATVFKGSN